jgi:hypothetical protein
MNSPPRDRGISRRSWLLAGLTAPLFSLRAADSLNVRYDGDTIRVAPANVHFLAGKPLERLKDGSSVAYVAQLDLLNEARISMVQHRSRFVVSYALWEEKFSVTQLGRTSRTMDGLSAQATENWCFDNMSLSTLGIPTDRYFWLRFDMRTGGPADLEEDGLPGISISTLIGLLGRKKMDQIHWGPLEVRVRLADLPRIAGRGSHG